MANLTVPARSAVVVTPSNSVDLPIPSRALYIGVGGDVSIELLDAGSAIVLKNTVAGSLLPIQVTRVNSTATTATNIIALF